jgi:hypothetical protein
VARVVSTASAAVARRSAGEKQATLRSLPTLSGRPLPYSLALFPLVSPAAIIHALRSVRDGAVSLNPFSSGAVRAPKQATILWSPSESLDTRPKIESDQASAMHLRHRRDSCGIFSQLRYHPEGMSATLWSAEMDAASRQHTHMHPRKHLQTHFSIIVQLHPRHVPLLMAWLLGVFEERLQMFPLISR